MSLRVRWVVKFPTWGIKISVILSKTASFSGNVWPNFFLFHVKSSKYRGYQNHHYSQEKFQLVLKISQVSLDFTF